MYPQTKIYFRIKQVTLKDGITENLRFEIRRNEDLLTITVNIFNIRILFKITLYFLLNCKILIRTLK